MFGSGLARQRAFWQRQEMDRPLLGLNIGFTVQQRFPLLMAAIPIGRVKPEDIRTDLFLADCDRLYEAHRGLGDYPYVSAPFTGIPWLEAILGCPIMCSGTSFWAEPCVADWRGWRGPQPIWESPWARKLLELMRALVEHGRGRYPAAPTLMRGPSDLMAAMGGASQLPLLMIDEPALARRVAELCTEVWIEVGRAQLELIPESAEGYIAGDAALRAWAPEKLVWLQEDAMALLSPRLYREFILPLDRRIAASFPCTAFHLHGSALWAIDELVKEPAIAVLELNLEDATCDLEATFAGWKKIQAHKPLVIWRMYGGDFRDWLRRVVAELPPRGLSIQVSTHDEEEAYKAMDAFSEIVGL